MKRTEKIKNEFLLKRGAYNIALIVVVIAAVIAVNVLSISIARNYPTDIDLTVTGENSISEDNIDYIKGVDKKVEIIICATKDGFSGETMQERTFNEYSVYFTDPAFLEQTAKLVDDYGRYNDNITITYADPDAPSFSRIIEKSGKSDLNYGDILVYSEFKSERGKEIKNARVLNVKDMFELAEYSYNYDGTPIYTAASSKVETAITSAIYSATSADVKTVAVLSGKSTEGAFDSIGSTIKLNAYNVIEVKDKIITKLPEEADIIALVAPQKDLAADEIEVLEKFLENGGNRGKDLMVFLSAANINLPNLYAFLAEWGAAATDGEIIFETDAEKWISNYSANAIYVVNNKSDYTATINDNDDYLYVVNNAVPMKQSYVTQGNRVSQVLMCTFDSALAVDIEATDIDDLSGQSYAVCIYTHDTKWDNDYGAKKSGVFVCSSVDLVDSYFLSQPVVGNDEFIISALNNICGRDDSAIAFTQKVIEEATFLAPTAGNVRTMRTIFVIVLPALVMATGIFVWIRRSRR
ncbi:MAG: Gldg family protein [Clostridia bacterium]|nr:Gldg family protein [Clostridia bacterium]